MLSGIFIPMESAWTRLRDGVHHNLHAVVESQVVRVLFKGKETIGMVYRPNENGATGCAANARKTVIVSFGAFGTLAVLERSGIRHGYDDHHLDNDKILGWDAQDLTFKLRPTNQDVASLDPEYQETLNKEFKN
ncbi:hypothetical protein F4861DRAFT_551693 [Xylaria intraflava]|nr:hypothetical protein F4861DRAFT_551693 [Xylaria intraflava]